MDIYGDGCVRAYKDHYPGADYVYSYRIKDIEVFEEIWDYIVQNGEVHIMN